LILGVFGVVPKVDVWSSVVVVINNALDLGRIYLTLYSGSEKFLIPFIYCGSIAPSLIGLSLLNNSTLLVRENLNKRDGKAKSQQVVFHGEGDIQQVDFQTLQGISHVYKLFSVQQQTSKLSLAAGLTSRGKGDIWHSRFSSSWIASYLLAKR
jgi:hypothetical protein